AGDIAGRKEWGEEQNVNIILPESGAMLAASRLARGRFREAFRWRRRERHPRAGLATRRPGDPGLCGYYDPKRRQLQTAQAVVPSGLPLGGGSKAEQCLRVGRPSPARRTVLNAWTHVVSPWRPDRRIPCAWALGATSARASVTPFIARA